MNELLCRLLETWAKANIDDQAHRNLNLSTVDQQHDGIQLLSQKISAFIAF